MSSCIIPKFYTLSLSSAYAFPGSFKCTVGPVLISFILYVSDRVVGIHAMEAPVLHPVSLWLKLLKPVHSISYFSTLIGKFGCN